jgi:aspartokinase-like uncharacterized kinase
MQSPLEKFILEHKLSAHAELSNDMIVHYKDIPGLQERFKHELIHRLGKELVESKSLDIEVHEKPFSTSYQLELFVFNKEELKKLIMEVEKHNIMNTFINNTEVASNK